MVGVPLNRMLPGEKLARQLDLDPMAGVVLTMIFVDRKYQGQGLSRRLQEIPLTGKTFALLYGFETRKKPYMISLAMSFHF